LLLLTRAAFKARLVGGLSVAFAVAFALAFAFASALALDFIADQAFALGGIEAANQKGKMK
jgi:hypothetical protein